MHLLSNINSYYDIIMIGSNSKRISLRFVPQGIFFSYKSEDLYLLFLKTISFYITIGINKNQFIRSMCGWDKHKLFLSFRPILSLRTHLFVRKSIFE